jgi:L-ribulokinase
VYRPDAKRSRTYATLYSLYRELHDAMGTAAWDGRLNHVMKELLNIRDRQRA